MQQVISARVVATLQEKIQQHHGLSLMAVAGDALIMQIVSSHAVTEEAALILRLLMTPTS